MPKWQNVINHGPRRSIDNYACQGQSRVARLNTYRTRGVHNMAHSIQIKHIQDAKGAHYTIWLTVYRKNAHRAHVVHNMAHCVR